MLYTSRLRTPILSCFYVLLFANVILPGFGQSDTDVSSEDPPGHNLPFGSHTTPTGVTVLQEFPLPEVFFEEYLIKSRPFIVKSILNASTFPAYVKWTDDFFRSELGEEIVDAEPAKKEIRKTPPAAMTVSRFLELYKTQELYMVQGVDQFQDINKQRMILDDVYLPRSLLCGGLQHLVESLVMWFSSGGTKSVLHSDDYENFNCVLDGNKELIFVDKAYKDQIEAVGFHQDGAFSDIDVDKVDMRKYPRIQEVPVQKAVLTKGDCLYIPYQWYHQVNSPGGRSLALNFWFLPLQYFNKTDCENKSLKQQTEPIANYGTSHHVQLAWVKFAYELRDGEITKDKYDDVIKNQMQELSHVKDEIFKYLDKDSSSTLSQDELWKIDPEALAEAFPIILAVHLKDSMPQLTDPGLGVSEHDEL